MKTLIVLIIMFANYSCSIPVVQVNDENQKFDISFSKKCSKYQWTHDNGRSQGGDWIWFSGRGVSNNLVESYEKAEYFSLLRLVKECRYPTKGTRFIERCDDIIGDKYIAFVRANITHKECQWAQSANDERSRVINDILYRQYLRGNILFATPNKNNDCALDTEVRCTSLGMREYELGNLNKALVLFDQGCEANELSGCFYAAQAKIELNNPTEALELLKKGCSKGHQESCYVLSKEYIKHERSQLVGKKMIQDLCNHGFIKACSSTTISKTTIDLATEIGFKHRKSLSNMKDKCKRNEFYACEAGWQKMFGEEDIETREDMLSWCQKGRHLACYKLGERFYALETAPKGYYNENERKKIKIILSTGTLSESLVKDEVYKNLHHFNNGCRKNNLLDCFKLGYTSSNILLPEWKKIGKDAYRYTKRLYKEKYKYFNNYCTKGDLDSCNISHPLGRYLGLPEYKGKGYERAMSTACEKGLGRSCEQKAVILENAKAKQKEIMKYYNKACLAGAYLACSNVADMYRNMGKENEYLKYLIFSCQKEEPRSNCYDLVQYGKESNNTLVKYTALKYACEYGRDYRGCREVVYLYLKDSKMLLAQGMLGEGCHDGDTRSCRDLAQVYFYQGKMKLAKDTLKSTCYRENDFFSCFEYANLLLYLGEEFWAKIAYENACQKSKHQTTNIACRAMRASKAGFAPRNRGEIFRVSLNFDGQISESNFTWLLSDKAIDDLTGNKATKKDSKEESIRKCKEMKINGELRDGLGIQDCASIIYIHKGE